jgi:hypothetical protein
MSGIHMPEPWREEEICYTYARRHHGDPYGLPRRTGGAVRRDRARGFTGKTERPRTRVRGLLKRATLHDRRLRPRRCADQAPPPRAPRS